VPWLTDITEEEGCCPPQWLERWQKAEGEIMLNEDELFMGMQERGEIRVIEVTREFFSELIGLLLPEERWMKMTPDGRSTLLLWTMAGGSRQLLFKVKL
jgi:hypothetical protein